MYGGGEHDRRSSLRDLLKAAQREGSIQRHEARRQHRDILAAANHRRSQEHDRRSRDSIHASQQDNHSVEDKSRGRASPVRPENLPSSPPPKIKPNGHMQFGGTMMEWHSAEKADRNRLDMSSTDMKGYKADKRIRVLKELQMYNSLAAKEKSAHNRKMMSVTVAGPWPIYDNDNDK